MVSVGHCPVSSPAAGELRPSWMGARPGPATRPPCPATGGRLHPRWAHQLGPARHSSHPQVHPHLVQRPATCDSRSDPSAGETAGTLLGPGGLGDKGVGVCRSRGVGPVVRVIGRRSVPAHRPPTGRPTNRVWRQSHGEVNRGQHLDGQAKRARRARAGYGAEGSAAPVAIRPVMVRLSVRVCRHGCSTCS